MKKSKVVTTYLVIAGILLTFIGGSTLIAPVAMKASSGVDLGGNSEYFK